MQHRLVPAEILFHFPLLQGPELVGLLAVELQAALESSHEVVSIVALEGEAKAVLAVFVGSGHGVLQTAGGVDHRNGAIAHGVHLAQAAGLTLGGHQIDVAAGVNPGSQTQIEGDLCSHLIRELQDP